jgi:sugar transferase (PEP-CTERM system associated)
MRLLENQQLAVSAAPSIPLAQELRAIKKDGTSAPVLAPRRNRVLSPARASRWLSAVTASGVKSDKRPGVLILGSGMLADTIRAQLLLARKKSPYRLVGPIEKFGQSNGNGNHGNGDFSQLEEILTRERVGCIAVAMSERRGTLPVEHLLACKMKGIRVEDGAGFYEKIAGKIPLAGLNPSFLIFNDGFRWPTKAAKRLIDLLFSTFCLIITTPLFAVLPILIKLMSPGPIFYRQERIGLNGSRFTMLKFRSMMVNAEGPGCAAWASENDPRVTRLGYCMRQFRLDELPQLVNVFRGDMSFVGPRPERPEFVASLKENIPYYSLRHTVKPGITGWAQVMFRYGASVQDSEEKLQYDLFYIKHMSILLDCRIFLKTFRTVLSRAGAW